MENFANTNYERYGLTLLQRTLGDERLRELFGFHEGERDTFVRHYPVRTMSDEVVNSRFDKSMWRMYNFAREYERFHSKKHNVQMLHDELAESITNIWTSFTEYAWGKNTRFYYKAICHPLTGETKLVMYDPILHAEESWEDAWEREDMRASNRRFIDRKSMHDALYASNYGNLRTRDELEGELLNKIVAESQQLFSGSTVPALMSVSPSPPSSKYAREMGYGASFFKQLSHWRIYSFHQVDDYSVRVDAATVFTYRPKYRLRRLIMEERDPSTGCSLSLLPSHIDFLKSPFVSRYPSTEQDEVINLIDQKLNTDLYLSDYLLPSFWSTRVHRNSRLEDTAVAKEIFDHLRKKYLLTYYSVFAANDLARDELLLKEILLLMKEEGDQMYAKYMADGLERKRGRKLNERERRSVEHSFIAASQERGIGGLCPMLGTRSQEKKATGSESSRGEKVDSLFCRRCTQYFNKKNIKTLYHCETGAEQLVCPFCLSDVCGKRFSEADGWISDKSLVGLKRNDSDKAPLLLSREPVWESDSLKKTLISDSDFAPKKRGRVVLDEVRGEEVYLDFFVPIRRKIVAWNNLLQPGL